MSDHKSVSHNFVIRISIDFSNHSVKFAVPINAMTLKKIRSLKFAGLFLILGFSLKPHFLNSFPLLSSNQIEYSIAIPQVSVDLSDLDVRDNKNKAIQSYRAYEQMKNLFTKNLNDLIVSNLTPSAKTMHQMMSQHWKLFSGFIHGAGNWIKNVMAIINPTKKLFMPGVPGIFSSLNLNQHKPLQFEFKRKDFVSLVSSILSSTQILR